MMGDALSLVFYLGAFGLSAVLFYLGQKFKLKTLTILAILVPTAVGGLRYMVGVDYVSYMNKLQVAPTMDMFSFSNMFGGMEPALWLFGHFLPWQVFFWATSFLTVLFFYLGFKNFESKHIGLCMFLMLCIIFPQAMGGIRQGVAMAMCFYAFSFIPKQKPWVFVAIVLCAMLFHYSSLVMLLMYPLYKLIVVKSRSEGDFIKRNMILLVASVMVIVVGFQIVQFIPVLSKYALYLTDDFNAQYGIYTGTHNILPEISAVVLMFLFYRHVVKDSKIGRFSFMAIVVMLLVTCVGFVVPLASRLADYFMAFFLLILPEMVDVFDDRVGKRLMVCAVIVYALAFFVGGIYLNGSGEIFPYQFIFLQ